jgi:hypothetical protein
VHGGTVRAGARPGGGSIFTVELPLLAIDGDSSPNVNDAPQPHDVES